MKTAIVFGATSGIGRALTKILIQEGYQVAITGRRLEKLEEIKDQYPNQVVIYQNDIQQTEKVAEVFGQIVKKFEKIDLGAKKNRQKRRFE